MDLGLRRRSHEALTKRRAAKDLVVAAGRQSYLPPLRGDPQHGAAQSLNGRFLRNALFLNLVMKRDFAGGSISTLKLFVAEYLAKRFVHFEPAIVANVAQLSKFIHEVIDSRAGCADHVGKNLMIWIGDFLNAGALAIHVGQPQQHAREPLLGSESQQRHNMILALLEVGQQIGHQKDWYLIFRLEQIDHFLFRDAAYRAAGHCDGA